jgi:exonuclease III
MDNDSARGGSWRRIERVAGERSGLVPGPPATRFSRRLYEREHGRIDRVNDFRGSPIDSGTGIGAGNKGSPKARVPPSWARISTCNMQAGHGRAAYNLQCVAKEAREKHLDIVFVQETKITSEKHAKSAGGYDIIATETSRNNQGGVAVFIRRKEDGERLGWSCEDAAIYDTNVIAVTFVSGKLRRRLIGVYLSPTEIAPATWNGLQRACEEAHDPIWILGDLNVNLQSARSFRLDHAQQSDTTVRRAEIQAFLATWGVENFGHTKLQRRKSGVWTWSLRRTVNDEEVVVKSICDYILGPRTDHVRAYQTRHTTYIRTDHRLVYVDLEIKPEEHKRYMRGRARFPRTQEPDTPIDKEYEALLKLQERQVAQRHKTKPGWIKEDTWKLIRLKRDIALAATHLTGDERKERNSKLKREIRRRLKKDRMEYFEAEAQAIENAMANDKSSKSGFQMLQKWYKRKSGVRLPMSHQKLKTVSDTWEALYREQQLTKPMFDLSASTDLKFKVLDSPLTEGELRAAAKRMKTGKAPGPSQFRSDTIKRWASAPQGTTDAGCFDELVTMCRKVFLTGAVPKRMREGVLVLLPKNGSADFRGISLLDCVYKLISTCINTRATRSIQFHEGVHGFRAERGCQTAIYEAKMDATARMESGTTYHQVFLDLSKAFDTVDRGRLLLIMRAYGFGDRTMRFFENCWVGSFVSPRAGGFYGPQVPVNAGVRQGDVISPLLFNVVVDAILRRADREMPEMLERVQKVFYADDGRLGGEDAVEVQAVLDLVSDSFERVGLDVNTSKTVSMTNQIRFRNLQIAYSAKLRAQLRIPEFRRRWRQLVECDVCGKAVQRRSMKRHCMYIHPELPDTHHHPQLWSPEPVTQQPDQDFTVDWTADPETGTHMYMACPHERCLSTRFKSPAMLYRHWCVAGHEGKLFVMDKRGRGAPVDATFRYQCPKCLLMMKNPVPDTHEHTKACRDNFARRMAKDSKHRNESEIMRSPFKSRGKHLTKVIEFTYLGRTMTATNDDTLAVHHALAKAKSKWAELRRILGSKPILTKTFVRFYKAIVLNVLLYGSETWRLPRRSLAALEARQQVCTDDIWTTVSTDVGRGRSPMDQATSGATVGQDKPEIHIRVYLHPTSDISSKLSRPVTDGVVRYPRDIVPFQKEAGFRR